MINESVVFLVGAGRSGTTLLYKLLSLHSDVAFVSNYDARLPSLVPTSALTGLISRWPDLKLASWFGSGGNAYLLHRTLFKKIVPTPAEGESIYARCGVPLHSSDAGSDSAATNLRRRFTRMRKLSGLPVLLTKRTANNRRIPLLLDAFPEARFINLIRDGRDVAYSLSRVHWWKDNVVFWAGRTPPELEANGMHPLAVCARNWVEEVDQACRGLARVPTPYQIEVRYESLLEQPLVELEKMLEFMGLNTSPDYRRLVDSLKLSRRPPGWQDKWSDHDLEVVQEIQGPLLEQLGYLDARPANDTSATDHG